MDTRPVAIKKVLYAFRRSELNFKVNYPAEYTMPDIVSLQFWVDNIFVVSPEILSVISGRQAAFSIPKELMSTMPDKCMILFMHDSTAVFGGTIFISDGLADDPLTLPDLTVIVNGSQEIQVDVIGLNAISEQVDAARGYAEQTASDKIATEAARDQVVGPLAHKADFWVTETKANADLFVQGLTTWALIAVENDEANDGGKTLYLYKAEGELEELFTI